MTPGRLARRLGLPAAAGAAEFSRSRDGWVLSVGRRTLPDGTVYTPFMATTPSTRRWACMGRRTALRTLARWPRRNEWTPSRSAVRVEMARLAATEKQP